MDNFKVMSVKLHGGNSGLDDVFYKCGVNRLEWLVVQVPHCEARNYRPCKSRGAESDQRIT